jgi:deoxycytidine triphosphate deaminase
LKPGIRIGQIVFFQHEEVKEEHLYKGRYNNDSSVKGAKVL